MKPAVIHEHRARNREDAWRDLAQEKKKDEYNHEATTKNKLNKLKQ